MLAFFLLNEHSETHPPPGRMLPRPTRLIRPDGVVRLADSATTASWILPPIPWLEDGSGGIRFQQGVDGVAFGAEGVRAALAAVDEDEDDGDAQAFFFHRLDGFEDGAASGHAVLDNHDGGTGGRRVAFDELACAVRFALATDVEGADGVAAQLGGELGGGDDRVSGGGGAAEGVEAVTLEQFADQGTDEGDTFGVVGDFAPVKVVGGFLAGGEGEVAVEDGFFLEDGPEARQSRVGFLAHGVSPCCLR